MEKERLLILNFLKWNDKNGMYIDSDRVLEGFPILSYNEALGYFFGVINDDIYYSIVDNIFELSFEEIIKVAKERKVYEMTINKLKYLIENGPGERIYRYLLE